MYQNEAGSSRKLPKYAILNESVQPLQMAVLSYLDIKLMGRSMLGLKLNVGGCKNLGVAGVLVSARAFSKVVLFGRLVSILFVVGRYISHSNRVRLCFCLCAFSCYLYFRGLCVFYRGFYLVFYVDQFFLYY